MSRSDYMLTAEEIRLRQRKRKRLLIVLGLVLGLVLAAVFGARPAAHQIKAWQARRHAAKAFALIDKEQWSEARSEATAALQLWPEEPEALRAVARFLSRTRQPDALEFWRRLREKQSLPRTDLRDEAAIALVAGEIGRAQKVLDELLAKKPEPADWILAAQIALRNGAHGEARAAIEKIVSDPRATEREQLQGALLEVAAAAGAPSAEAAKEEARNAWTRVEKIARGESATALDALVVLARRALTGSQKSEVRSQKSDPATEPGEAALPAATPEPNAGDTPAPTEQPAAMFSATELSAMLTKHPLAQAPQKLLALDLLEHDDPSQREALVTRAIAEWKEAEPVQLASLATWLNSKQEFQRHLDTIPLEKALKNRDLFLQHLDALGALSRWDEIKRLLDVESFPLDPVVQLMYLARCNAQLGEKTASENNWQRALETAGGDIGKLMTLAEYAEKNGANDIAGAAYATAAGAFPRLRMAQQGRLRMAQASGETKKIHTVLADMLEVWPNDTAIQNDEAYLRLLLVEQTQVESRKEKVENGKESKENAPAERDPTPNTERRNSDDQELAAIEQLAVALVQREPASLAHRTLLALVRLRQNRAADALQVYAEINVPANVLSPSALAVHAAVLAANGNSEGARTEAEHVPVDKLLPEERAVIAALLESK